ncbi:MAG: hypothetical protein AAGA41_02345 [Pseudomonadota bacterium]
MSRVPGEQAGQTIRHLRVRRHATRREPLVLGLTLQAEVDAYQALREFGVWQFIRTETSPGNQVKVLRSDDESVLILVRLEPGTTFLAHYHPVEEATYVVECVTCFGDIHLKAGD